MIDERQHLWARTAPLALLLLSCAHTESAKPAPAHAPPQAAAQPAAPKPPPQDEGIEAFMADHFIVVTWARDCVISGNLNWLREPLGELADYKYTSVAPGGWMPFIADLQQAARLTSEAETLDLAATGVATMARVCGDCHQAKVAGPEFPHEKPAHARATADSLEERMQRHIWAADRMWEGLTEPSDEAWNQGAKALADAPEHAPSTPDGLPPEVAGALREVREVGVRALGAQSLKDRADAYGLFLATCANCHAHDVELEF